MNFRKRRKKKHKRGSGSGPDGGDCCCLVGEVFTIGDCFVATAANDDDVTAPQVTTLRAYRDQRLAAHPVGRRFTHAYYAYGPYGAQFLREHPSLKPVVRVALEPVVRYAARRIG